MQKEKRGKAGGCERSTTLFAVCHGAWAVWVGKGFVNNDSSDAGWSTLRIYECERGAEKTSDLIKVLLKLSDPRLAGSQAPSRTLSGYLQALYIHHSATPTHAGFIRIIIPRIVPQWAILSACYMKKKLFIHRKKQHDQPYIITRPPERL